jgi:dolichol-phosphate mannosyltransferase
MTKISIILPTYNEFKNIHLMIEEVIKHVHAWPYEIIVVDDNSPDGTAQMVQALLSKYSALKLIVRKKDKGLIPSIKAGIKAAKGDICIWLDADMSMPAKSIIDILKKLKNGADLVLGSRYIEGGGMKGSFMYEKKTSIYNISKNIINSEDSLFSALVSKFGNKILRLILGLKINDYSSGYFGGKKTMLEDIGIEGVLVDYCIALPYNAIKKGYIVAEVPIILTPRKYGRSKTSSSLRSIITISFQCLRKALELKLRKYT